MGNLSLNPSALLFMLSVLSAIAALLLLVVLIYLFTVWSTFQLTLQCFRAESIAADQLPEHLNIIFEPVITELEQCGFHLSGTYATDSLIVDSYRDCRILLRNDVQQTYAWVGIHHTLDKGSPVSVTFLNFFTDNGLLVTQSERMPGVFRQISQEIDQYFEGSSISEQWQVHQYKLEQLCLSRTSQILTPEEFRKVYEDYFRMRVDQLVHSRELHWVQQGERYRYALGTAFKIVFRVMWTRFRKRLSVPSQSKTLSGALIRSEANLTLEIEQFQRWQRQRKSGSRRGKSFWLLGSLALFIASYSALMAPQKLFIFVAVLLMHEGGHVLAMKLFGYRDTAMLFIPFLGALATARKEDATLTEKVWISLAGPLPGLFLGIGMAIATSLHNTDPEHFIRWYSTDANWVRDAMGMLIALNLFNLLPMYPLDGGQVADLLLFSRNPYLGVMFKSLGVLLLGLLGLVKPLFLMFAVAISLTIPNSFRLAKLNAKLRKASHSIPSTDREGLTQYIFAQLQQPPYQALPFSKKYILALGLLDSYRENSAKWTTRVGLSSLYLFSLLVGVMGALIAIVPHWDTLKSVINHYTQDPVTAHRSHLQQELTKADQRLQSNPKDIQAYLRKGRTQLLLKDAKGAIASANQVLKLDPNSSEGYGLRGMIRRRTGDIAGAKADETKGQRLASTQRIQQMDAVLRIHPKQLDAYIWRADAHLALEQYQAAMTDVNQALRLDAKNMDALLTRGEVQFQMKNYKGAIADATQVISLDSERVDAYDLRSRARQKLGDLEGSVSDENKAQALYEAQED
jgi:tetratricopeptide (TPR) repeat protein